MLGTLPSEMNDTVTADILHGAVSIVFDNKTNRVCECFLEYEDRTYNILINDVEPEYTPFCLEIEDAETVIYFPFEALFYVEVLAAKIELARQNDVQHNNSKLRKFFGVTR